MGKKLAERDTEIRMTRKI